MPDPRAPSSRIELRVLGGYKTAVIRKDVPGNDLADGSSLACPRIGVGGNNARTLRQAVAFDQPDTGDLFELGMDRGRHRRPA